MFMTRDEYYHMAVCVYTAEEFEKIYGEKPIYGEDPLASALGWNENFEKDYNLFCECMKD